VSVVSGNAPESIAELQIKSGDHIAPKRAWVASRSIVGKNRVSYAFTDSDTKPSTSPVTWKHAFCGPFKALDFYFVLWKGFSDASRPQAVLLPFRRGTKLVWCLDSLAKIIRRNSSDKKNEWFLIPVVCLSLLMRSE
jgi:hypothetical protein